jgi:hypothetical protein
MIGTYNPAIRARITAFVDKFKPKKKDKGKEKTGKEAA